MPNVYRFPNIVFPDLVESPLYGNFQVRDRDFILPAGESLFIPFDRSYLNVPDQLIVVPIATNTTARIPRIHLWLEPCDVYPRGTRLKFRMFISEVPYQCVVYVGRHYVIPLSSYAVESVAGVEQEYRDDMFVISSGLVRMRFYTGSDVLLPVLDVDDSILTDLPSFTGLVEVARC